MAKYILTQQFETKTNKEKKLFFFHCLFCYSQRSAELNTVTKLKTKKSVSDESFALRINVYGSLLGRSHS